MVHVQIDTHLLMAEDGKLDRDFPYRQFFDMFPTIILEDIDGDSEYWRAGSKKSPTLIVHYGVGDETNRPMAELLLLKVGVPRDKPKTKQRRKKAKAAA